MAERWINLEGVVNMRDVGGLPLASGGTVARHVLIRSDNLQDLTPAARAHLVEQIGVTDVVDLRTDIERTLEGPSPLETAGTIRHHRLSLLAQDRPAAPGDTLGLPWSSEVRQRDAAFWGHHYRGYLSARPDSVSTALRAVAEAPGATIVHCAAGKDRTGTVVALALEIAGVPREHIVADYVLTEQRLAAVLERLLPRPAYGAALAGQSLADQMPRAASLELILTSLQDGWGGAAGWLREVAGWSEDEVARLRQRLSEGWRR